MISRNKKHIIAHTTLAVAAGIACILLLLFCDDSTKGNFCAGMLVELCLFETLIAVSLKMISKNKDEGPLQPDQNRANERERVVKHNYEFFPIVKGHVDKLDILGTRLLDEYDIESLEICDSITKDDTQEHIASVIANVFSKKIGNNYYSKEFLKTAAEIRKDLSKDPSTWLPDYRSVIKSGSKQIKAKIISIDCTGMNEEGINQRMKVLLGFPEWYGMNWDAMIDCLRNMRDPGPGFQETGLTKVTLDKDEMLIINLRGLQHADFDTKSFLNVIRDVNESEILVGESPQILINLMP